MQITKKQWVLTGIGFVVVGAVGVLYANTRSSVLVPPVTTNTASSTGETSLNNATSSEQTKATQNEPFPVNASDSIASWSFKGAYSGNDTLTAQANADITHLTSLLGKGQYDDYDLYNGMANDYDMLGDAKRAYQNFNRAIAIHPKKGLAFVNLAHLMDQFGAYHTAVDAYAKAVMVEPGMLEYHIERLTYLTRQFPKNTALIIAALSDVSKQFGDNASILTIEAEWLTGQGRYADAIKAWQTAKMLLPGKDTTAIDVEIARLKAKQ